MNARTARVILVLLNVFTFVGAKGRRLSEFVGECTPGAMTWTTEETFCCPDSVWRTYTEGCCGEGLAEPSAAVNGILWINVSVPKWGYQNCQLMAGLTIAIGPGVASLGQGSFSESNLAGADFTASDGVVIDDLVFYDQGSAEQLTLGLMICTLSFGAYCNFQPYLVYYNDLLQQLAQLSIFATLLSSIVLKYSSQQESSNTMAAILATLTLAPPVLAVVMTIIEHRNRTLPGLLKMRDTFLEKRRSRKRGSDGSSDEADEAMAAGAGAEVAPSDVTVEAETPGLEAKAPNAEPVSSTEMDDVEKAGMTSPAPAPALSKSAEFGTKADSQRIEEQKANAEAVSLGMGNEEEEQASQSATEGQTSPVAAAPAPAEAAPAEEGAFPALVRWGSDVLKRFSIAPGGEEASAAAATAAGAAAAAGVKKQKKKKRHGATASDASESFEPAQNPLAA